MGRNENTRRRLRKGVAAGRMPVLTSALLSDTKITG